MEKTIHIYVRGGVVQDVTNLPKGWNWELHDQDDEDAEAEAGHKHNFVDEGDTTDTGEKVLNCTVEDCGAYMDASGEVIN